MRRPPLATRVLLAVSAVSMVVVFAGVTPVSASSTYYGGPAANWTTMALPTLRGYGDTATYEVTAAACASDHDCWAVVMARRPYFHHSYVAHYNGTRWLHALGGTGAHWSSISCVPDGTCTLAGDAARGHLLIERLGSHPTRELLGTPGHTSSGAIGCAPSGRCVVATTGRDAPMDETFLVQGVGRVGIPSSFATNVPGSVVVSSAWCTSNSACVVVGNDQSGRVTSPYAARFNGRTWARVSLPITDASGLTQVSCAGLSACVATGNLAFTRRGGVVGFGATASTGVRWSPLQRGGPLSRATVIEAGGTACVADNVCLVVAKRGVYLEEAYVKSATLGQLRVVHQVRFGATVRSLNTLACTTSAFCVAGLTSLHVPEVVMSD